MPEDATKSIGIAHREFKERSPNRNNRYCELLSAFGRINRWISSERGLVFGSASHEPGQDDASGG
jgi:hypothetical protein